METSLASLGIAFTSLLISIFAFMLKDANKAVKYGVGMFCLLLAFLFGLIAAFSFIRIPVGGGGVPVPQNNQPISIDKQYTGAQKERIFTETLGQSEVIVGSAWGVENTTGGCVALIVKGSGTYTFRMTDGVWEKFKNVNSSAQAESLLQNYVEVLQKQNGCTSSPIRFVRIP